MPAYNEFELQTPFTRNQALQSREYRDWVTNRKGYRREQLNTETIQLIDNYGYFMQQTRKGVMKLGPMLLIGGALVALSLAVPARAQHMLKVSAAASAPAPAPPAGDNAMVIAMMDKGLDESIIVAKIKSASWSFQLSDDDLLALRRNGVPAPVVAAMVESSVLSTAKVAIDDQPVQMNTLGQAKTAGRVLNNLTGDLTPLKENAFLVGAVSTTSVSPMPAITVRLPKGDSISNYVLVKLSNKRDRRELEVGSGSGITNSRTGLRPSAIRRTQATEQADGTFRLTPLKPLEHGEYMVYVMGSSDESKSIYGKGYDFSVLQ